MNHYRPLDREQSSLDPCVPCNCSGPGLATPVDPANGECVMNAEVAATLTNMVQQRVCLMPNTVHTADATQLDSCVASAVCTGLYILFSVLHKPLGGQLYEVTSL